MLALFAGNLAMKPVTTPVLRRFGFRAALLVNGLVVVASLLRLRRADAGDADGRDRRACCSSSGLARSMQFTASTPWPSSDVPPARMASAASTLSSMAQQMTLGMGIAFGALCLRLGAAIEGNATGTPSVMDFRIAFGLVAVVALAALFDVRRLAPDAGAEVSGHRREIA